MSKTSKTNGKMKVEMYVGIDHAGLGQSGDWYTTYIEIPCDTPANEVAEVAEATLTRALDEEGVENVAFVGVYNVPGDDEDDTDDDE